jgi:DNA-binding NtrC family response regulator
MNKKPQPFVNLAEVEHQYTWEELQEVLIDHTLRTYKGNRTHAARALGISVRTIRNKIKLFNLEKKH